MVTKQIRVEEKIKTMLDQIKLCEDETYDSVIERLLKQKKGGLNGKECDSLQ